MASKDQLEKPPKRGRHWLYWSTLAGLWALIALACLVFYYALDLPDTDDLWKIGAQAELSLYSSDDELIARRGRRYLVPVLAPAPVASTAVAATPAIIPAPARRARCRRTVSCMQDAGAR